ncbi:unnamed protein product [Symbiodinium sp. CCMP2592]|nr:unnamed protein product [Symbiodinium sp. CCMP2592]CAE7833615.1 unnamed protein product [Symbiodinium sp. CCMP2592]
MAEAPANEPERPPRSNGLRVRRARSALWPEKGALCRALEESRDVRAVFRANKNHLLAWPKPDLVGVASLRAMALNVTVLKVSLEVWAATSPICKSMSVDWLKEEVTQVHLLLNPGVSKQAVGIYVDSWGIKRLSTLAMRRWKAPIATLRDRSLRILFYIMTEAWGEYAPEVGLPPGDGYDDGDDDDDANDAGGVGAILEGADEEAPGASDSMDPDGEPLEDAEALDSSMAPEASDVLEVADAVAPEASDVLEVADAVAPEASDVLEVADAVAPEASGSAEVADAVAPEASGSAEVSVALDDELFSRCRNSCKP